MYTQRMVFSRFAGWGVTFLFAIGGVSACGSDGESSSAGAAAGGGGTGASGFAGSDSGTGGQSTGGSVSGGQSGAGGASSVPCTQKLHDDFSGAVLDESTWRTVGVMGWDLELLDGRLTFTPSPGQGSFRSDGLLHLVGGTERAAAWTQG